MIFALTSIALTTNENRRADVTTLFMLLTLACALVGSTCLVAGTQTWLEGSIVGGIGAAAVFVVIRRSFMAANGL